MAYHVKEIDNEEEARIAKVFVGWWQQRVKALSELQLEMMGETAFVRRMMESLAQGVAPETSEESYLVTLAWKYRRRLPRSMAPKLPPHDPIVKEMEGRA